MSASFRDPSGRLLFVNGRVLRLVHSGAAAQLQRFLDTQLARDLTASGRLVSSAPLDHSPPEFRKQGLPIEFSHRSNGQLLIEHECIALQSFPFEWPPEMLFEAGVLTLDLAEAALSVNYSLKDATPYNILFSGTRAVFVDLLSFEERDPHDPTWLPLNQFLQTFLLPLLVNRYYGLKLDQLFISNRDGIEPAQVSKLASPLQKLSPLFFSLVTAAQWLTRKEPKRDDRIYQPKRLDNPEKARFILEQQLKRLRRLLLKVEPTSNKNSAWTQYMSERFVSSDYLQRKEDSVRAMLKVSAPSRVLDVGCNTGYFSALTAKAGAKVVAIDQDPEVVGAVWRRAVIEQLDILPLVVNLGRPTPAIGWRNEECPSFLERTRGQFDLVLMLAVLHHLLIVEQIPLSSILELTAELTTNYLLIEFVDPADGVFQHLVRRRGELFAGLTRESFETEARRWFRIENQLQLNQTRTLYLLTKTTDY